MAIFALSNHCTQYYGNRTRLCLSELLRISVLHQAHKNVMYITGSSVSAFLSLLSNSTLYIAVNNAKKGFKPQYNTQNVF